MRLPHPFDFTRLLYTLNHLFTASTKGHGVHSPFAYLLCEEVFYNTHPYYEFATLKRIRKTLLTNTQKLQINDLGAGSKHFKQHTRSISEIAKHGISSEKQSEILFRLIALLKPKTSIELGTSLGLNTLYMAQANREAKVYSLEGASTLIHFARELAISQNVNSIEFIEGDFKNNLEPLLKNLITVDLAYIDGNHTYDATLNYFNLFLNKINTDSVLVFDDIYWSSNMLKAWKEIKKNPRVKLSIDTFYTGYLFFKSEIKEPLHLKFRI